LSRAGLILLALAAGACIPSDAAAAPTARMSAAFTPERLGAPTAVSFAFRVADEERDPAPLVGIQLAYPRDLGLATSDLGVMACAPAQLRALGPAGCPANSHMGYGSAVVQVAFGSDVVKETTQIALLAGPSPDGYLHLLVYASGKFPIEAAVILTAVLLPGHLAITVPPIPSLPAAPYVFLTEMHVTLGGNLTYYETLNGRPVAYHPAGVGLPTTCPHGGFRFAATFRLLDGEHTGTRAAVPCPPRRMRR
jgi:hypothetical protein